MGGSPRESVTGGGRHLAVAAILVPALAVLAATPAVAQAPPPLCSLTQDLAGNNRVLCNPPYIAELDFEEDGNTLTLDDFATFPFRTQSVTTDLSGDDTIITTGGGGSSDQSLTVSGAGLDVEFDLREGDDTVSIDGFELVGRILGGPGDDRYEILNGTVFLPSDPPGPNNGVIFVGGPGNDSVFIAAGVDEKRLVLNEGDDVVEIAGAIGVPTDPLFDLTNPTGIDLGPGDDLLETLPGSLVRGDILAGEGADIVLFGSDGLSGSTRVLGDSGDDVIALAPGANLLAIDGGPGNDTIVVDGLVDGRPIGEADAVVGAAGDDEVVVGASGTVIGRIVVSDGDDLVRVAGSVDDRAGPFDRSTINAGLSNADVGANIIIIEEMGQVFGRIFTASGDDLVVVDGLLDGTAFGERSAINVGEDGDDAVQVGEGGTVLGRIRAGAGQNVVTVAGTVEAPASGAAIVLNANEPGDAAVTIEETGLVVGRIVTGAGDDTIVVEGTVTAPSSDGVAIFAGAGGTDVIEVSEGGLVRGRLVGSAGQSVVRIGGTVIPVVPGGSEALVSVGASEADTGPNSIVVEASGTVLGRIATAAGADTIVIEGLLDAGETVDGRAVTSGAGPDAITILNEASVLGDVLAGAGPDAVTVDDAFVGGTVFGEAGEDFLSVSSGSVFGDLDAGEGNDQVAVLFGSLVGGDLVGGAGDDVMTAAQSQVLGSVLGGTGADTLFLFGSTVEGDLDGGPGADTASVAGATIGGAIRAVESVTLLPDPLAPSGPYTIVGDPRTDVELIAVDVETDPETGSSFSLSNVGTLRADASEFALSGPQGVSSVALTNGAVLRVVGETALVPSTAAGFADLTLTGSTLDLRNARVGDRLSVNNLNLNSATVGFDVDPISEIGDQIAVNGAINAQAIAGPNRILIAFTRDPIVGQSLSVPLFDVAGADPGEAEPVDPNEFAITFTPSLVTSLALLQSPDGALFLASPDVGIVTGDVINPVPASQDVALTQGSQAVGDVIDTLADTATGFGPTPTGAVQVTPTFGIFANGQAGRLFHDGFAVSGPAGFAGATPAFTTDAISVIGTGELDASAEFGLEDVGLRVSAFGGYVRSDVDISRQINGFVTTPFRGEATNEAGVVGGTVLVSRVAGLGNLDYALASAAGFFGATSITLGATGATGRYDTTGFLVSVKGGRNIAVSDTVRLDLRVGAAFNAFYGDAFTDSAGVGFGESRASFGLLSFEPGVSTAVPVGNYVVQPFGRLMLHQRVGYANEAEFAGGTFDFDDGDTTIGVQLGANMRITEAISAGLNVEGRASDDQTAVLGRLAVKFTIPRS